MRKKKRQWVDGSHWPIICYLFETKTGVAPERHLLGVWQTPSTLCVAQLFLFPTCAQKGPPIRTWRVWATQRGWPSHTQRRQPIHTKRSRPTSTQIGLHTCTQKGWHTWIWRGRPICTGRSWQERGQPTCVHWVYRPLVHRWVSPIVHLGVGPLIHKGSARLSLRDSDTRYFSLFYHLQYYYLQ